MSYIGQRVMITLLDLNVIAVLSPLRPIIRIEMNASYIINDNFEAIIIMAHFKDFGG